MTFPRIFVVVVLTAAALATQWFRRVANDAATCRREARPRTIDDYYLAH
jgi:hypothetical protein